jgi:hypothetical protein
LAARAQHRRERGGGEGQNRSDEALHQIRFYPRTRQRDS